MSSFSEGFNQKVSLICEYNNKSPLFVRLAGIEIEKNNLDNAIAILNEGIKKHPEFSVAYFLLGKAHTIKGNYSEALKFYKDGSELIHSPKTFDYYLNEIDKIKKQRSFFNISHWAEFANENFSAKTNSAQSENLKSTTDSTIEETLIKLTAEIEDATKSIRDAKNKIEENRAKENLTDNFIISETLANIYINQNELQAALSIYKKLLKKNPDKENYFNSKIEELKSLLKA